MEFGCQSKLYCFFPECFGRKFSQKTREFSFKLLHYLKFSVSQSDAYHLKWGKDQALCTSVSFDAGSDCERTFVMDFFCRRLSKNELPEPWSTLPKTVYSVAQTIKANWAT